MRAPSLLVLVLAFLGGCTGTPASGDGATDTGRVETSMPDAAIDGPVDVTAGDGGGPCSFNRECLASERCECDESTGCRCAPGARGTGRSGLDPCTTGNDCASALCVEAHTGFLCSGECMSPGDCPAALPRCTTVPTVGTFCARDPSAPVDAAVDAPPGCPGACATTDLMAVFGTHRGAFERAQHGNAAGDRLHIEAHSGGDPACPTETSPTPRRTLVLAGVRATADPAPQTQADGVTAALLDFTGDLTSAPLVRATAVRVVPRAFARGQYVSLELSATFPDGTITGGLFARWCASLDDP